MFEDELSKFTYILSHHFSKSLLTTHNTDSNTYYSSLYAATAYRVNPLWWIYYTRHFISFIYSKRFKNHPTITTKHTHTHTTLLDYCIDFSWPHNGFNQNITPLQYWLRSISPLSGRTRLPKTQKHYNSGVWASCNLRLRAKGISNALRHLHWLPNSAILFCPDADFTWCESPWWRISAIDGPLTAVWAWSKAGHVNTKPAQTREFVKNPSSRQLVRHLEPRTWFQPMEWCKKINK